MRRRQSEYIRHNFCIPQDATVVVLAYTSPCVFLAINYCSPASPPSVSFYFFPHARAPENESLRTATPYPQPEFFSNGTLSITCPDKTVESSDECSVKSETSLLERCISLCLD